MASTTKVFNSQNLLRGAGVGEAGLRGVVVGMEAEWFFTGLKYKVNMMYMQ
jgi:hypothetical protein